MTRAKSGESNRGKPIKLPPWFLGALNVRCGNRSRVEICAELNTVAHRYPPWRVESVYDFLAGKVTTDVMMDDFLLLFPDLPPPLVFARSEAEAHRFQELIRLYPPPSPAPVETDQGRKLTRTIEDTGARSATTKTGERRRETTQEKSGPRRRAGK
jgi:hypothetical protein